jgi:predicted NBD/HSP70 family sugar kinase
MMSVADDPALKEVADEAAERLGAAIDSLG